MANEITAETPLTFEMIQAADGKTMVQWMKTRRAEVDAVLQAKSAEIAAQVVDQNTRLSAEEEARAQRQQEIQQAQEKAQADRAVEIERRRKLTPEERVTEDQEAAAAHAEEERAANEERIAEEKDRAYLSTLPKGEYEAEIKRREDEAAAKQKAEDDAVAAEAAEQQRLVDEAAQQDADQKAAADKAVAEKAAADAAEQEKQLAEKARIAEEATHSKTKIVKEYQVRDEEGNPIGRPTHLEADSWEEMSEKQQAAHENAVRYAERMKKRAALRPTPAVPQAPIPILSDEQRKAFEAEAQTEGPKAEIAKSKLEIDDANKERLQARQINEQAKIERESILFINANKDFYPCTGNAKIMSEYLHAEGLEWNAGNLEIAYEKLASKLTSHPVEDVAPVVPANPAPVVSTPQPAAATPAAPAVVPAVENIPQTPPANNSPAVAASVVATETPAKAESVVPTPSETPAPPAVNPPAPVKRSASGIEPGSLHGARRQTTPVESAQKSVSEIKREIARMPLDVFKKNLRNPKFREMLKSAGIQA